MVSISEFGTGLSCPIVLEEICPSHLHPQSLEPLVGKTEMMHYNVQKVHKSRRPVLEMFSAGFLRACIYVKIQCV